MTIKKLPVFIYIFIAFISTSAFRPLPQNAIIQLSSIKSAQATFGKISPANGDLTQPINGVELKWQDINIQGATYQYCFRTSRQYCTSSKWVDVGTNTSVALPLLTASTTYYWQVRAKDTSGRFTYADNRAWWKFRTVAPAPVTFGKASPANGATGQLLSLNLSWGASSGTSIYYQYCYNTAAFTGSNCPAWFQTTATSVAINGLAYATTYYWQVRVVSSTATTYADGGAVWHFTTQNPPPFAFTKLNPLSGATNEPVNPTLTWNPSSNATQYGYCVTTSSNNTCDTGWVMIGSNTSVTLSTNLNFNTVYYWQVKAVNAVGELQADGGDWRSFTTMPQPVAFNKINPLNNALDQPISPWLYWWSPDSSGTYSYCINTSAACPGSWTTIPVNTPIHITTPLANNQTYYWQVQQRKGSVNTSADGGAWWSFTTLKAPPTSSNQSFSTPQDTPLTGQLAATSNYTKTFSTIGALPDGQLTVNSDGSFSYTPPMNFRGKVNFQFIVEDGYNAPAGPYTATITMTAVNHPPALDPIPDQAVTAGDLVYFLASATDLDIPYGDALTFALEAPFPAGATIDPASGVFAWATPADLTPGAYPITVKVTDSAGAFATQVVAIVVSPTIPVTGGGLCYLPMIQN